MSIGLASSAFAQSAPAAPSTPAKEDTVALAQYTVNESPDNPYLSKQALSGTRVAMSILDIPQTVFVVTSAFIQDSMSQRMLDAAKYVTPVAESTLLVGGDRYTIRGFQVSHEFIDGMVIVTSSILRIILTGDSNAALFSWSQGQCGRVGACFVMFR